jgi:hypothetical protein
MVLWWLSQENMGTFCDQSCVNELFEEPVHRKWIRNQAALSQRM